MATEDLIQDPSYTTPDGTPLATLARNPHQNVDIVHGAGGGSTNHHESLIVLELVDYVAEHAVGGSTKRVLQTTDMIETQLSGTSPLWNDEYPHPPNNQFVSLDVDSSWKWVGQLQTEAGKHYNVTSSINWRQATIFVMFGSEQRPLTSFYETMDFVGDGSLVEVGYLFQANTTRGVINDFYVEVQGDPVLVPSTCTNFVRKIVDGIVSDFESDGVTPYIVSGTILAHCPDASGCDCSSELTDVKQELVDIKALVKQLLNGQAPPPTQTQVDTGQPSLRLAAGTYTKAQVLAQLNIEHYNTFVDTNAGLLVNYGLNSIVFVPSLNFNLSVAGLTTQTYDYPVSMEASGNEYLLQEVDDFVVVVPAGETLDVHMVVWKAGIL